ncbi:hypothetical protein OB919_18080 [Halobacteria archaeon AArc-curdl1]|uniref:DUF8055 domain-containing protein n=1 Tax=Natronosalvus hydrolyticus TaxID=2979988 RepID=A0AAP3E8G2_9EURY|nr:hypothetical protein [Halobacteria archaeon AArc-curdl1]
MSEYGPQIAALERRAEREREALEASSSDCASVANCGSGETAPAGVSVPESVQPDEEDESGKACGLEYLRHGVGPAVWVYVEGRSGGDLSRFSAAEMAALERAMNLWFECYAACHGVDLEAEFTVREVAELLLKTHNIHDVGALLTGVPDRSSE